MNKELNYYNILNLDKDFTKEDIKSQYRKLSKKWHPDLNDGDDTNFKLINEAHKVLTNDDKRGLYDKESKYGRYYDPMLELLEFEFSNSNISSSNVSNKMSDFKSKDMLHIVLELSDFTDKIEYTRSMRCPNCNGTSNVSVDNLNLRGKYKGEDLGSLFDGEIKCDICEGTGSYNKRECPGCRGEGYINLGFSKCDKCQNGIINVKKKIELKKEDFKNNKLKLEYHGNQSKYDGRIGNLYLIIKD
jgi:molecular chaperone DnaJ